MRLLEGIMCKVNDNALHAGDEESPVFETLGGKPEARCCRISKSSSGGLVWFEPGVTRVCMSSGRHPRSVASVYFVVEVFVFYSSCRRILLCTCHLSLVRT